MLLPERDLPCDVLLSVHPGFAGLNQKLALRALDKRIEEGR